MSLLRHFLITFIFIFSLIHVGYSNSPDSLLNAKPTRFTLFPEIIFKSADKVNLDFPRKIVLSVDNKNLYFLGKKGLYTVNLANNITTLKENQLYLTKGSSSTWMYRRRVETDSVRTIEMNTNNKLITLDNIFNSSGYIGSQTHFTNLNFPYTDFIVVVDIDQENQFKVLNLISDRVGGYYFTAINDGYESFNTFGNRAPNLNTGGSEVVGTFDMPNIYKIQDVPQVKFNFYDYTASSLSPNFTRLGAGICVYVDKSRNYYTIEQDRVLKWTPDGRKSEVVAGGNGLGDGLNQLILNKYIQKPIEIDSKGNILINDYYNRRVMFWPKGQKVGEVIASDKLNNIPNFLPNSIAIDSNENIYVSDESSNSQILKFKNCAYLPKPVINKISNEELITSTQLKPNWYLNNRLIPSENNFSLKPKTTGYYKVQLSDIWGCTSVQSDSVFYNCIPAKPEIELLSKSELKANPAKDVQLYGGFSYSVTNYGIVKFTNLSKNHSEQVWTYSDGTTSTELNPSKYFAATGSYLVKLQVKNTKGEIVSFQDNIVINYPDRPNVSFNYIQMNTFKCVSYETEDVVFWDFGDGQTSLEKSPVHIFVPPSSGICTVKLLLKGVGYVREIKYDLNVSSPYDLKNGKIVDIPIGSNSNSYSIWTDFSGYQNHANYNGKITNVTNQGIFPGYSFSSINLPGCNEDNLNQRIQIPISKSINYNSEITFSGWFGVDPSISMDPSDGSCRKNGRQVLFSKAGDGIDAGLPGFTSSLDVKGKEISLRLEFSKNSGDFSIKIPIGNLIDTVKTYEQFEKVYYVSGRQDMGNGVNWPVISSKSRVGELVAPFQHFVISFSENKVIVFLNGKKIYDNKHLINFSEINAQDLYVGAMGPLSIPFNSIFNLYPFKGRIDKLKVYNRILTDSEVSALYNEKNIYE